jgi:hypothetical protein
MMPRAKRLPKVPEAAWHGPFGKAVEAIAPATEADPIAILTQALALFGALAGESPFVRVGGVRHPARVWPLIVGKTSAGRKGTALHEAESFARRLSTYAAAYLEHRVVQGLSSGEGLLAALGAAPAAPKDGEPPPEAPGADGRLTVVETEFAKVLTAAKRDGNTLGPILRQLWENDRAGILTRQAPLQVDGAHLTVIAHITPGELRLKLAESDVAGGTLNRFLLVASERTQLLPHEMLRPDMAELTGALGDAADEARFIREVRRDRHANDLWTEVYAALNADEPDGQLGAVLARGPAYTMRLALLYALADGSSLIHTDHLLAALAVWHYAAESARLYFADGRTRDDAERLAEYIASAHSRTGTEIYNFFKRNKSRAEIQMLLGQLMDRGDVGEDVDKATGGRPVSRFMWVGAPRDAVEELLEQRRWEPRTTP